MSSKEVKKNKWEKLFLYSPYKNEPDLLSLFTHEDHVVQVALPVIGKNQSMDFYEWDKNISSLQSNRHHILEPKPSEAKKLKPDKHSLICVPCVALDQKGYRLGFGGGFYDRYLATHAISHTMGVVFSEFLVSTLPSDSWDIRMRAILTEKGIYHL